jgi:hypothetical protein
MAHVPAFRHVADPADLGECCKRLRSPRYEKVYRMRPAKTFSSYGASRKKS